MVHRISGLALAIFLPLHFLTLGLAIEGEARLERFLRWSDQPLVKLAESALIFLLILHMLGGLRLLVIENGRIRFAGQTLAGPRKHATQPGAWIRDLARATPAAGPPGPAAG